MSLEVVDSFQRMLVVFDVSKLVSVVEVGS